MQEAQNYFRSQNRIRKIIYFAATIALALTNDVVATPRDRRPIGDDSSQSPSRIVQEEFSRQVAPDAGSAEAPILFCVGLHIEPLGATVSELVSSGKDAAGRKDGQDFNDEDFFRIHADSIKSLKTVIQKHGGKLTVQAQTPFTKMVVQTKNHLFSDLADAGHELALHFHEDAHLGKKCERLPPAVWTAVMKEEIAWIKKAAGREVPIRYWSGGNPYPRLLEAASAAGLEVMSDHKNPRKQETDDKLLSIRPWRPAGGPSENDMSAFARHDPNGKIIYLPDGIFAGADFRERKQSGDAAYFDYLTDGLERSLKAAQKNHINVFHITVHSAEFHDRARGQPAFTMLDQWLTKVMDPLVKAGKVRWATFSEMADAYKAWEKTASPAPGSKLEASLPPAGSAAAKPPKAYMTFAVNVHDWVHMDESADTIVRLVGIFRKYKVRGDFYLSAPTVAAYAKKRPDAIKAILAGGMTVSYHVRPPCPIYIGFDEKLKVMDQPTLARTVRAYETFGLDLATGDLQRDQPGGYAYVTQVFGKPPVCVSPQSDDRRIKQAVNAVYREMGAKMVIQYHETGTPLDRPFEYLDGLLIRPSDFSITHVKDGNNFWWNRIKSRRSDKYDPTAQLKVELSAWQATRPPFITSLIHENNFYRQGPESWKAYYMEDTKSKTPRQPPYDLNAPDESRPRPQREQDSIWQAYERMVAYAAANLVVATSEDIVKLAEQTQNPELTAP